MHVNFHYYCAVSGRYVNTGAFFSNSYCQWYGYPENLRIAATDSLSGALGRQSGYTDSSKPRLQSVSKINEADLGVGGCLLRWQDKTVAASE